MDPASSTTFSDVAAGTRGAGIEMQTAAVDSGSAVERIRAEIGPETETRFLVTSDGNLTAQGDGARHRARADQHHLRRCTKRARRVTVRGEAAKLP